VLDFDTPACVVVKHNTPCGAATHPEPVEAFRRALAGDPGAAFGGVVACNRPIDVATAGAMTEDGTFFEVILAPGFDAPALGILCTRPKWGRSVRLLELPFDAPHGLEFRSILGGLLAQTRDDLLFTRLESVTTAPSPEQRRDLMTAWRLVKHAKSNAIVLVKGGALVGVGAGEVSRVRAAEIAVQTAGERARGAVAASDAFFPFADGVETLARAGIVAVIQPGGSKRDEEVFEAARRHGLPMVLTGVRHFRH
jgi:phosphoribosylaminoimidazolecarboxamide formyltransferase/IMP cyclohydrolase